MTGLIFRMCKNPVSVALSEGAKIVAPCKVPIALLHVKELSLYDDIPLWDHPDNACKIKVAWYIHYMETKLYIFFRLLASCLLRTQHYCCFPSLGTCTNAYTNLYISRGHSLKKMFMKTWYNLVY